MVSLGPDLVSGMRVDIWTDVVCPYCAIGATNFLQALEQFHHRDEVQVIWHSYELNPGADPVDHTPVAEALADKYQIGVEQAQDMLDEVTEAAAEAGWEFRMDRAVSGNTFDAHRLIHFADARGLGTQMELRLMKAHFTDGLAVGDPEVLADVAAEIGLERDDVVGMLASNAYAAAVRSDEALARQVGVRGVPFYVLDEAVSVRGAQPVSTFLRALEQVWQMRQVAGGSATITADGVSCTPDDAACVVPADSVHQGPA